MNFRKGKRRKLTYSKKTQMNGNFSDHYFESYQHVLDYLIKGKRSDHTDPKRLIQAISKYFHCCQLFGEKLAHDECSIDQAQIIQEVCRTECDNNLSLDDWKEIDPILEHANLSKAVERGGAMIFAAEDIETVK